VTSVISMTFLYFISTALTFWSTDYLTKVMKFDKPEVMTAFIIILTTSPTGGVVFGGIFVQKYIGGYEQKHSIAFVCFQLLISSLFILPVYVLNELWTISLMLWLLLFFGGSTIPILQGITISSLPHSLRASGNSICNLSIYTLGFSLAPLFYGAVFDWTEKKDPKISFVVTLSWGLASLIFSVICGIYRYRRFNDPKSQENRNLETLQGREHENNVTELEEKSIDLMMKENFSRRTIN
jgi:MFS family permease